MFYQYTAYNSAGQLVRGKLTAAGEEAVNDLLSYAGYQAVSIKPFVPFLSLEKLRASLFPVKSTEIILFYRELSTLLESGLSIVTSLDLLRDQADNITLKKVLEEVLTDLRSGNQLSTALNKHPKVFSQIYCRLLAIGEKSGNLEGVLKEIADYMEKEVVATKDIKNALIYPVITFVVAIVVIALLVVFVLPAFGSLYGSLGIELPVTVRMLISFGETVRHYGLYSLVIVLLAIFGFVSYIRTQNGRFKWDKIMLKLPLVGRVNHMNELARSCRSMSLLFHAGLPLTEVISQVVQSSGNRVIAKSFLDVQQDMVKGEGISRPMSKNRIFLPMMVHMIKVGEETGNLDTTLLAVARSYEAETDSKTHTLIAMIQPTMTLIIGLVIGLIAVSLMSAMYSMYGQAF